MSNLNFGGNWDPIRYDQDKPCGIQDCNNLKGQPTMHSWLIDFECEHEFVLLHYRDQTNPDHVYYPKFNHCKKCGRNRTWFVETHDEHTQKLLFEFDDQGCVLKYYQLDSSSFSGGRGGKWIDDSTSSYCTKWTDNDKKPDWLGGHKISEYKIPEGFKSEEEYIEWEKKSIRRSLFENHGYTNIKFRIKITRNYKTRKHGMESYF